MTTQNTSRVRTHILVTAALNTGAPKNGRPVDLSATWETTGDVYRLAENAISAATNDVARGWAGVPQSGWSERAKAYLVAGQATLTLTVWIDQTQWSTSVTVNTEGQLARSIVAAAHTAADDAHAWLMQQKNRAKHQN